MAVRARFDWDAGNVVKCLKHGVTIEEIEALFEAGAVGLPDLLHSESEDRFIATGRNDGGRPVLVVFTLREVAGEQLIRPISARYMHKKEVKRYEQTRQTDPRPKDDH
jgi:uncharacterized DUF497 family protein